MRQGRRQANGASEASAVEKTAEVATVPFAQRLSCTIAEACEVTGLGRTKLYELIGESHLATTTVGRRRLVLVRSLLSLLETRSLGADRS
jgi:excisionase family DNA binding protein